MATVQNQNAKSITLVIKEASNQISLESTNTYNKNCLNGYKIINLDLRDSTDEEEGEEDCRIHLKNITADISKITCLTLSHCDLTDVPFYISGLLLKNLDFSHNLLKCVPSCVLKGLKQLEALDLSSNCIKEFETEPQCVENLRVLNLANNKMLFLPIWIVTMRSINLTELYYSYNQIGSTQELGHVQGTTCKLKTLELKNCAVLSDNIQFIKLKPNLTSLNLSNNLSLHRNSVVNYEGLFNEPAWRDCIEVLNLSQSVISFLPENICAFANLKELYLSETDIFWLPRCFTSFERLEVLDLSKNSITHLPVDMDKMRSLRVLKVQYNAISSVPDISGLTNLKVLDLYRNELESFVYDVDHLKWIDLEQNLIETSVLGGEYADKKSSYRANNQSKNRLDGCRNDINEAWSSFSSDSTSVSSLCSSDRELVPQVVSSCEEENWDTWTYKSHPDITTSDEEWQGYTEVKPKKKAIAQPKFKIDFNLLFADADEW